MADFLCFFGECGVERGMDVLLKWLWEWKGLVQREGQARQGRLSVCAQGLCKDAKPTKHTDDCSTKSDWDSADFEMSCMGRGAVSDNNTKAVTV